MSSKGEKGEWRREKTPAKYVDYKFCDEYLIKSDTKECREIDIDHNLKIADMLPLRNLFHKKRI